MSVKVSLLEQNLEAIRLLFKNNLKSPCIALIFSTIESLAWIESGDGVGSKERFISWVEKYFLPTSSLNDVSALDLYGARCGVLHTGTWKSALSENGKAKRIGYWSGKLNPLVMSTSLQLASEQGIILVKIEALIEALEKGETRYFGEIENDTVKNEVIGERLRSMLTYTTDQEILKNAVIYSVGQNQKSAGI